MKTSFFRLAASLSGLAVLLVLISVIMIASPAQGNAIAQEPAAVADTHFTTSYPLPNEGAPKYLLRADGDFWFTAPGNNAIGKLVVTSTVDYSYTFFPVPTGNSIPYDLAWDGTNIWFTASAANKIGKVNVTSGDITEYDVPTPNSEPAGITVAGGMIWFVERLGNKLGAFDPATETFTEYLYDPSGAELEDVAARPSSNYIWFTAPGVNRLVRFDRGAEAFDDVPTSDFGIPPYTPSQVVVDSAGNPWVSTTEGLIGRFAAATFQYFRWYDVGSANSQIDGLLWLAEGSNNKLWFTESNTGYAGQLTTQSGGATLSKWRFPITDEDGSLMGIVTEADGTAWIADSGNHALLEWAPPYAFTTYLPVITN